MRIEKIVIKPELSREEFLRRGGLKGRSAGGEESGGLREEALELFATLSGVARAKALVREVDVAVIDASTVDVGGEIFRSQCLAANLSEYDRAFAYVATSGRELENFARPDDSLALFWTDLVKELALEAVVGEMNARCSARLGSDGVASLNPGAAEPEIWPIEQQRGVFRLLGDTYSQIGVLLTDRLLMIPTKSLSGLLMPADSGWVSCTVCSRRGCMERKAAPRDPW